MQTKYYDEEEEVIDLLELFFALKRKWLWIALSGLLMAAAAFGVTRYLLTPMYESSTTLIVRSNETTVSSLTELQMGTRLTNDYATLAVSHQVLDTVIENLALPLEYEDLKDAIEIENPDDSRIMEITVTYDDPATAKEIVDEIAAVMSEFISDTMEEVPPKIIDEGEIAENPSSPNLLLNVLAGFLAGAVLCCGVITFYTLMDDTIKSEEDLERYLGIPTLASVPDRKDYISGKKKAGKKRFGSKGKSRKSGKTKNTKGGVK